MTDKFVGVFNASRPDSARPSVDFTTVRTPARRAELRAELIELVRVLEESEEGRVIQNISAAGFTMIRLAELKRVVILLSRILLDEGE